MKNIKFKTVTVSIVGANGEMHLYHENNEYKNKSKENVINIFKLEEMPYMATQLEEYKFGNMNSFNTYNWSAPITLCGVMPEDIYDGVAFVNIHLGGDVRGNYSEMYICEDVESLLSQSTFLGVELTNGETFSFDCDNGEGYFDFDTFDPYYIDFDKDITEEQMEELTNKTNI